MIFCRTLASYLSTVFPSSLLAVFAAKLGNSPAVLRMTCLALPRSLQCYLPPPALQHRQRLLDSVPVPPNQVSHYKSSAATDSRVAVDQDMRSVAVLFNEVSSWSEELAELLLLIIIDWQIQIIRHFFFWVGKQQPPCGCDDRSNAQICVIARVLLKVGRSLAAA